MNNRRWAPLRWDCGRERGGVPTLQQLRRQHFDAAAAELMSTCGGFRYLRGGGGGGGGGGMYHVRFCASVDPAGHWREKGCGGGGGGGGAAYQASISSKNTTILGLRPCSTCASASLRVRRMTHLVASYLLLILMCELVK